MIWSSTFFTFCHLQSSNSGFHFNFKNISELKFNKTKQTTYL